MLSSASDRSCPLLRPAAAGLLLAVLACPPLGAQATSTDAQKFTHSPAEQFDSFGKAVVVQGDVALINSVAVDAKGAAFCYRRAGGVWTLSQKFRGNDTALADFFGFKAQMAGEYAVIGAHQADTNGANAGAAYVFRDNGSAWMQVQKLVAPDGGTFQSFGWSVAIGGDLIVVGAIDDDDLGLLTGSAYVFRRSGSTWVFEQKLHASTPDDQDEFGWDVDTDGQTIVVSTVADGDGGVASGAVYVFEHRANTWVQAQRIVPADGADEDWFGWDIDLDGDTLAVGSPKHDEFKPDGGAVYVYRRGPKAWVLQDEFAPSKLSASDVFGWAVALQGDRVVAGAPSTTIAGGTPDGFDGALYQFHDDGTHWVEVHQWLAGDNAIPEWPAPQLGQSCALDGTTVLGGAPFHDGGAINSGAAYRFELTDLGLDAVPDHAPAGAPLSLQTHGGLAGGGTALLLTHLGGVPFSYVVWLTTFDAQGKSALGFIVPPAAAGLSATFRSAGFWHAGPFALSNLVTVSFQ